MQARAHRSKEYAYKLPIAKVTVLHCHQLLYFSSFVQITHETINVPRPVRSMSQQKEESMRGPAVSEDRSGECEEASASLPVEVPNGGLMAWIQVAGAFSIFFNTW